MRFGQVREFFYTGQPDDWQSFSGERRAVAVLRVVVKTFSGENFADDPGVDGFVRVHRAFDELRQADGEREQGD